MPLKRPRPDTPRPPSRFTSILSPPFTTRRTGSFSPNFMDDWFGPWMSRHERDEYRGFRTTFSGNVGMGILRSYSDEDVSPKSKKRKIEAGDEAVNPKHQQSTPRTTRNPAIRTCDPFASNLSGLKATKHPGRELGDVHLMRSVPVPVSDTNRATADDAYATFIVPPRPNETGNENSLHASAPEYIVEVDENNLFNAFDEAFEQYDAIDEQHFGHLGVNPPAETEPTSASLYIERMFDQMRRTREASPEYPPAIPISRRTRVMYAPPVGKVWVGDVHTDNVGADGNAAPVTPTTVKTESDAEMEVDDSSVSSDSDYHGVVEDSGSEFEDPDTSLTTLGEDGEERSTSAAKCSPTPFPEGDDEVQDKTDSRSETMDETASDFVPADDSESDLDTSSVDWDGYIPQSPRFIEESEEDDEEDSEEEKEEEVLDSKSQWAEEGPPSPCIIDDSSDEDEKEWALRKPRVDKRVPSQDRNEESDIEEEGKDPRRPWGAKRVPSQYTADDANDEKEELEVRPRSAKRVPGQYCNKNSGNKEKGKDPPKPYGDKHVPGAYTVKNGNEEEVNRDPRRPWAGKRIPSPYLHEDSYNEEEEDLDIKRPWATKTVPPLPPAFDESEAGYDGDEGEGQEIELQVPGMLDRDLAGSVNVVLLQLLRSINSKISVLESTVRSLQDEVRGSRRE